MSGRSEVLIDPFPFGITAPEPILRFGFPQSSDFLLFSGFPLFSGFLPFSDLAKPVNSFDVVRIGFFPLGNPLVIPDSQTDLRFGISVLSPFLFGFFPSPRSECSADSRRAVGRNRQKGAIFGMEQNPSPDKKKEQGCGSQNP